MFSATRFGVRSNKASAPKPFVRSTSTYTSSASAVTHNIPMPAGIQAGDLLVTFYTVSNGTTLATISGWTRVDFKQYSSSLAHYFEIRVATGVDTLSITLPSGKHMTAIVYCLGNANTYDFDYKSQASSSYTADCADVSLDGDHDYIVLASLGLGSSRYKTGDVAAFTNVQETTYSSNRTPTYCCQRTGLTGSSLVVASYTVSAVNIAYVNYTVAFYKT